MIRAVLSLGANLGDRVASLAAALDGLAAQPRCQLAAVSAVYRTRPWGPVEQPDFANLIALVDTDLDPDGLWRVCAALEEAAGRERAVRWGPRTLDIDVIIYGFLVGRTADLALPHPRARERAFVLVPWLDVDPDAELPGAGAVADLLASLDAAAVDRDDVATSQLTGRRG